MWKFCGKAQFPNSFGQFAQNYAEAVPFHKISTPGNEVKLRYFSKCLILRQSEAVFRVYRYLHMLFLTYQITMFSENTQHFFNVSIYFFSFTLDSLTYFKQMFPFHTLWKYQNTKRFLVFSGGIKWEHWPEIY